MKNVAIRVSSLSKRYFISKNKSNNLRYTLTSAWNRLWQDTGKSNCEFWALKNVSFDVECGEVIGVIGKNGAGKSTLLKILSRITLPTSGYAELDGTIASLLEVGTGFHPELTGRENVFLNGTLLGMSKAEIKKQFDEIIAFSGIEPFIDTPVKHYSSGMYVRLAFAVAAHLRADILLIDEILAVGDIEFQEKCLKRVNNISQNGRTIIFVSHNMSAISKLCNKSIFLKNGRVEYLGATKACIQEYLKPLHTKSKKVNFDGRYGKGEVTVADIKILNEEENQINAVASGDDIIILIEYSSFISPLTRVIFRVEFYNSKNEFLFSCGSRVSNHEYIVIPSVGRAYCRIPKLPLNVGKYLLNILIRRNGIIEDCVPEIMTLNVEKGMFYETGVLPNKSQHLLIQYNWNVE